MVIGDSLDEDEDDDNTGEDEVRDAELFVLFDLGEEDECVRWRGDGEEEERLGQTDEEDVEEEKHECIVHFRAQDWPPVIFGSEFISSLAPVVECQTSL